MTTSPDPSQSQTPGDPRAHSTDASPRERLISRLIDGVAGDTDWAELGRIAATDTSIFTEIVRTRRAENLLQSHAQTWMLAADRVQLPLESPDAIRFIAKAQADAVSTPRSARPRRSGLLGWGIAACLALALGAEFMGLRPREQGAPTNASGLSPAPAFASSEQALNAYLELGKQQGKVLGEMPQKFVIQSQPAPGDDAALEVVYLRQFIERAVVKDLFKLGTDELGRTILIPAAPPAAPIPTTPL
jgi:hypothetical protein